MNRDQIVAKQKFNTTPDELAKIDVQIAWCRFWDGENGKHSEEKAIFVHDGVRVTEEHVRAIIIRSKMDERRKQYPVVIISRADILNAFADTYEIVKPGALTEKVMLRIAEVFHDMLLSEIVVPVRLRQITKEVFREE